MKKCSKCGAELADDTRFCSYCGCRIDATTPPPVEENNRESENEFSDDLQNTNSLQESTKINAEESIFSKSLLDRIKEKLITLWNKLSFYEKIVAVSAIVFILLALIAYMIGNVAAFVISILQIGLLVVSLFMHKGIILLNHCKKLLKSLVLVGAIFLTVLNVMSYSWKAGDNNSSQTQHHVETELSPEDSSIRYSNDTEDTEDDETPVQTDLAIEKNTEYAYMSDEWNVYVATAVSSSIIKVEHWDKTLSSSKKVEYDSDIGTYKTDDSSSGFEWVDEEHTAFRLTVQDKNNSRLKNAQSVIFTINTSSSDMNKGSNYDKKIISYVYTNDGWHSYRAIALTDTLIKIEAWCRTSKLDDLLYGYDVCLIDLNDGDTDFEWTDDEHTSFTITMQDEENDYYWEDKSLTLYAAEENAYDYMTVIEYLDSYEIGEDEASMPQSAFDYKHKNYEDVQKELSNAGFTNISFEILYDIFWGWTDEGEVDSVSVDGDTSFEQGDVFKNDAAVVITYHMKEEDDPNNLDEANTDEEAEVTDTETDEDESVTYSTNTFDTVKDGNSGVYAYKRSSSSYDIYWVVDFDEGYVYWFTDGNNDSTCDRVKMDSGDLNSVLIITYHDGNDEWSYGLHFKYKNQPSHLIMEDQNGTEYDYYTTNLDSALSLRRDKTIKDY